MRLILSVAALVLSLATAQAITVSKNIAITVTTSASAGNEEFAGPFANWINAQTGKRQDGTGSSLCTPATDNTGATDVTTALQSCINALTPTNPNLYLPAGTYKFSSTLNISSDVSVCGISGVCAYISILGHHPSDTKLLWAGATNGTMVNINGFAGSTFSRITFDGGGVASLFVDQSFDGVSSGGKTFDTGNQISDDVFQNGGAQSVGYRCGALNNGCSEVEVIRDTFNGLQIGVMTCNANALDVWVWYSKFLNNTYGITNDAAGLSGISCGPAAGGNYHVSGSLFQGSTAGDIYSASGGAFNLIDNFSTGSNQFIPVHGDELTLQRNRIINTTNGISINACFNVVLLDNQILTKAGNAGPVVQSGPTRCGGGRILSLSNTFTVANAIHDATSGGYNEYYLLGDVVDSSGASINTTPPTLPGPPSNNGRTIYEASPSGSGTACTSVSPCSIQQAITNASNAEASGAVHPVAHVQAGSYAIATTIDVPATVSSGIQIIGDGSWSKLTGNTGVNPVLKLNGPSQVVLRDFQLLGTSGVDGVLLSGADQVGGVIYIQHSEIAANTHSLFLDALSNVLVEAHDLNVPYNTSQAISQTGPSHMNVFFGSTSGGGWAALSGGANLNMIGPWQDINNVVPGITATGAGNVTLSTANFNSSPGLDLADLSNFAGNAVLLNLILPSIGAINVTGAGSGSTVVVPFIKDPPSAFFTNSATGDTVEFFGNDGQANSPSSPNMTAVATAMQSMRTAKPIMPGNIAIGKTAVSMYRLLLSGATNALHVSP
jgi:hypothetical protein